MKIGKVFEENFKKSVPKEYYFHRLKDQAVAFSGGNSKFSTANPFDCMIYTGKNLHCIELKSKNGAITFWREDLDHDGKKHTFEIKKHQIVGLSRAAEYNGVYAGIVINFRNADKTIYIPIGRFTEFTENTEKNSINYKDALEIGIELEVKHLKVNERYNIQQLIEVIESGKYR